MSKKNFFQYVSDIDALSILGTSMMTPKERDKYVHKKLKMLRDEFKLYVSPDEERHLYSLNTEKDIDRACTKIIKNRL